MIKNRTRLTAGHFFRAIRESNLYSEQPIAQGIHLEISWDEWGINKSDSAVSDEFIHPRYVIYGTWLIFDFYAFYSVLSHCPDTA